MAFARLAQPHPVGAVRRASARWRLGRIPAGAAGDQQADALGPGPDGDPRERAHPSAWPSFGRSHPRRGTGRTRCAVGDGGGRKMRGSFGRHRRDLGRSQGARLHCDAEARGRIGALGRRLLAGQARRDGKFERSADALADRERAVLDQPARRPRARVSGMGRRAVSRSRNAARAMEHHP